MFSPTKILKGIWNGISNELYLWKELEDKKDSLPIIDDIDQALDRNEHASEVASAKHDTAEALKYRYLPGDWLRLNPADAAKAVKCQFDSYHTAAEQGYAEAQYCLGELYALGKGVPKDYAKAMKWFLKAADQGHAYAQANLGIIYADGLGVPEDAAEAVKWFRKAADQELASAQTILGTMYANGEGVPEDNAEAVEWYRRAAMQGYPPAQCALRFGVVEAR